MQVSLELLDLTFAICRLDPNAPVPDWPRGDFVSVTRTTDELSIVCAQENVPEDVHCEKNWRCFRIAGKLDLSLVGVIAGLTTVLSQAGICVFVVSSFDTDYLFVREVDLKQAVESLEQSGHEIAGGH